MEQNADNARLNTRGLAAASLSKTGRGQVTSPMFLLVPQVKLPKRLDLARDAERAHELVPGLIVANSGWRRDGRPRLASRRDVKAAARSCSAYSAAKVRWLKTSTLELGVSAGPRSSA